MNPASPQPSGARSESAAPEGTHLAELRPGDRAVVHAVQGSGSLRRRLLEMGFVNGTALRVVRLAPLGDPMEVELHGYHLSLRSADARTILVERTG